ncbi:helix-turn-helix transcriptional regulator [Enterobacter soli]|uniref:helix-turn-helix transcriptional regulator n=1 Tax=Enterobacter soli TaxID=885040 RepID=UPI0034CF8FC0
MYICQIRYVSQCNIIISGIRQSLESLVSNNPDWQFTLSPLSASEYEPYQLLIIDGTKYLSETDFPAHALRRKNTLIMLKITQRALMERLVTSHRCSILCVDEFTFRMRDILDEVLRKKRYLSPLAARFLDIPRACEEIVLTPAEHNIVKYLRQGYCGVEISKLLFRSEKTVSTHKRKIMGKLGVKNDVELTRRISQLLPEQLSS